MNAKVRAGVQLPCIVDDENARSSWLRREALTRHLRAAAAALGPAGVTPQEGMLDEAAESMRRVEVTLGELADGAETPEAARRLWTLRDAVSVHLSAATSLRLLDLGSNAAVVLRRAIDSVPVPVTTPGAVPRGMPFSDAG